MGERRGERTFSSNPAATSSGKKYLRGLIGLHEGWGTGKFGRDLGAGGGYHRHFSDLEGSRHHQLEPEKPGRQPAPPAFEPWTSALPSKSRGTTAAGRSCFAPALEATGGLRGPGPTLPGLPRGTCWGEGRRLPPPGGGGGLTLPPRRRCSRSTSSIS